MRVDSRFLFYTYDYENKEGIVYLITLLIIPRGIRFNIAKFIGKFITNGPHKGEKTKLRKRVTLKYVMSKKISYRFYIVGSFKIMNTSKLWDNLYTWIINKDLKSIFQLLNTQCQLIHGELKFANLIQVND